MNTNIFDFWARLSERDLRQGLRVHPDDRLVYERVGSKFEKEGLPDPFFGPLRTAPVVLLFLSPGWTADDQGIDASDSGIDYCLSQVRGDADLPNHGEHKTAAKWIRRVIGQFGVEYGDARSKVAFLNIGPYKSATFHDWGMLASLPSARASLEWAQSVLFPEAENGARTVVCLRSPRYWGLGDGQRHRVYGKALYAPAINRGGFMLLDENRDAVSAAVQKAISH